MASTPSGIWGMSAFNFYFAWTNESQYDAVINVDTSLVVSGFCRIVADTGVFSGHHNTLFLTAFLDILRQFGWGTDPQTGASLDGTYLPVSPGVDTKYFNQVSALSAQGGGLFDDPATAFQSFNVKVFDLSRDNIIVPGGASTVFQVALLMQYGIEDGDLTDEMRIDFGSDQFERRVICPAVFLELLTAPPPP
jgi:hypothetical protein